MDLDKAAVDFRWAYRRNERREMADIARDAIIAGTMVVFPDGRICDKLGYGSVNNWHALVHFAPPGHMTILGSMVLIEDADLSLRTWVRWLARLSIGAYVLGGGSVARADAMRMAMNGARWPSGRNYHNATECCALDAVMLAERSAFSHAYNRAQDIGRLYAVTCRALHERPGQRDDVARQLIGVLVADMIVQPDTSIARFISGVLMNDGRTVEPYFADA